MPSVSETAGAPGQMAAGLAAGLDVISQSQTVSFTQYNQQVLPLDGYVFWISTGSTVLVKGSIHQSLEQYQNEDETIDINRIIFTTTQQVDEFNNVSPTTIMIGSFNGVSFAFSRRDAFYQQAGLYHYVGDAIYPAMESQIVDNPSSLTTLEPIVSNSLPIWLTLNQYMPMYPSFLVPDNAAPPYASVHIEPGSTEAIGSAPAFDYEMTHTQLAKERVKITMYGMNNQQALDFQDYVNTYSLNTDNIGVMNIPIIRDEKRTQAELSVIAMKKSFEIDVSYYQTRVNDIARQFITSALANFIISPAPF
jgi:hypothetical protein